MPQIKKPPQFVRWDLIIMFFCELWGFLTSLTLPTFLRSPIYRLWGIVFKCKMDECRDPLSSYKSLQEFFIRPLKDGLRPIEMEGMASPVDGTVLTCGPVINQIEQVKGHSYTLTHFLGPDWMKVLENKAATPGIDLGDISKFL
jgi:phosphatidylserine decarboxylase